MVWEESSDVHVTTTQDSWCGTSWSCVRRGTLPSVKTSWVVLASFCFAIFYFLGELRFLGSMVVQKFPCFGRFDGVARSTWSSVGNFELRDSRFFNQTSGVKLSSRIDCEHRARHPSVRMFADPLRLQGSPIGRSCSMGSLRHRGRRVWE